MLLTALFRLIMSSMSSSPNLQPSVSYLQRFLRHPKRDQYILLTFGVGLVAANYFLIYNLIKQDQANNNNNNNNRAIQPIQNIANPRNDFATRLWKKRKTVFAIGSFIVVATGCSVIYLGWKASQTKTQFVLTTQFQ